MKLTIPRDTLAAAVDRVARLASKRSPLPILKCVLLQAEDGCLRLSATDLQLSVSIQTEANVEIGGEGSGIRGTRPARRGRSARRPGVRPRPRAVADVRL